MGVKEDIKAYIVKSGWTISKVQEELNKRNPTSDQACTNKLCIS